jgi:hypothetical protein
MRPFCSLLFFSFSGPRTLHRPCGELIDVHLHHAEIAPAVPVAAAAVTVIVTEETVIARGTATATEETETETEIVTGMIATVGIRIEIAEIGTVIFETRRRTTIVAAGAPTASAACRPSPSRKKMFLGPRLQSERVMVLACLPSVRIRTKNCFVACLVAVSLLLLNFGSVVSPKIYCAVGLYVSYFTVVS